MAAIKAAPQVRGGTVATRAAKQARGRAKSNTASSTGPSGPTESTASTDAPLDIAAIQREAVTRRAQERLGRIEEMRRARQMALAGKSQREIAETLLTTQPRVHRMLKAMEGRPADAVTPEEIILRAAVDDTDRTALIRHLIKLDYTFREHAPEPFEGAVGGSWDDVRHAFMTGLLSAEEYEHVRDAVQPRSA